MYHYAIIIILCTQLPLHSTSLCQQSNNHKNYSCNGFRFRELSASPVTRREIILTKILDCKETSIKENEKGLVFPNLQMLQISCGVLKEIDENAFANLNHLEELNLENNSLSTLPNNMFKSLNELKILSLTINKFEVLTNEVFSTGLSNLKKLILSYNSIKTLMPKTLSKLTNLEELFLNNNAIGPLTTGFFDRLLNIRRIDLSFNYIKYLNNAFSNTRNLQFLNISYNSITDLPSRVFQNTHLEVIDLSNNELGVVYEDSFKWIFLQELYLQNNKITLFEVTGKAITTTPLKRLDLRNNRLVFLEDGFIKKATALVILNVDTNPWDCGCSEKMTNLRSDMGLQVSTVPHRGITSICVRSENNNCLIDKTTLQAYYKIFLEEAK